MFPFSQPEEAGGITQLKRHAAIYTTGLILSLVLLLGALLTGLPARWADGCLFAGTGLLLLLLGSVTGFRSGTLRRLLWGPNPFILLLLFWSLLRAIHPPDFNLALGEVLRFLAGLSAYFLVAYSAPLRRSYSAILFSLIALGAVISLVNFSRLAERGGIQGDFQFSVFATHEDAGSLMLLLFPLCIALAIHPKLKEEWRLVSFVPTLILVVSLMVTRCRSAFAGAAMAAMTLILLQAYNMVRLNEQKRGRRRSSSNRPFFTGSGAIEGIFTSPLLLLLVGIITFCFIGGTGFSYFTRSTAVPHTLVEDLGIRLTMWRGAVLMLMEKPLTGWGLGAYTGLEATWTHLGFELNTVHRFGSTHNNIAHNYYVQWAADTGVVGLFLHAAVVSAFLAASIQTLRTLRPLRETGQYTLETALLTGITAAIAGSCVDAFASPSYNYQGVSTIWWTLMGAGVGIMETVSRSMNRNGSAQSSPPINDKPLLVGGAGVLMGTLAVAGILGYGTWLHQQGKLRPRGVLRIIASPAESRSGKKGEHTWVAVYTNEHGVEEATMPGTQWKVVEGPLPIGATIHVRQDSDTVDRPQGWRSTLLLLPPPGAEGGGTTAHRSPNGFAVRVEADYRDAFGRRYTAASF